MTRFTDSEGREVYMHNGREITAQEYAALLGESGPDSLVGFKPLASDALAVNPRQIPQAMADARKKGFNIDFTPDGRPLFTSSKQFREYAKRSGFRHKGYA